MSGVGAVFFKKIERGLKYCYEQISLQKSAEDFPTKKAQMIPYTKVNSVCNTQEAIHIKDKG